jgi:flagellin-like hook-associated protein FlgL
MSIVPVGNGRVPFSIQSQLAISNVARRQKELTDVATELSTGRRLQLPSDDPNDAVRASILQRAKEQQTQFRENVKQGTNALSSVDGGLRSFSDALDSVKSLTIGVVDGTKSDADYAAAKVQVDSLIDQLLTVANQKYLDRYTLAGDNPGEAPFKRDGNNIVFTGDSSVLESLQGSGQLFPSTITADSAIGVFSSAGYGADLAPDIRGATRLSTLNQGKGVDPGLIQIATGSGSPVVVDLSKADSVQDVLDIINNNSILSSQGFSVAINPTGQGLRVASGPTSNFTITGLAGSTTAADLGIEFFGAAVPSNGKNLLPLVTLDTPLSVLNGGAGVNTSQPLVINNGPYSASIDLSTATTVQDVINQINNANVRVRAELNSNGTGINVLNTLSGASYSIVENSSTGTVAQGLGILTTNLNTSLADFNGRAGIGQRTGPDLRISVADGTSYDIDLDGTKTVADLKQRIETATGSRVTVGINPVGGLQVRDNTTGAGSFVIQNIDDSNAAKDLGIAGSTTGGGTIFGTNNHQARVKGIFDTLLRVSAGLASKNTGEISLATLQIDSDQNRLLTARGSLGAQLQTLDQLDSRMTDELATLSKDASLLVDADLSETITKLTAQQTALQAALASGGRLLQGSLLDYL